MCKQPTLWEKCVDFHGHICPGLALGYKAAVIALEKLDIARAMDEELFAIAENDACSVDGVQVVTGCTIGKGNLFLKDYGKQVYIFGNRRTGKAVRVAVKPGAVGRDEEHQMLREKLSAGTATAEEKELFWEKHEQISEKIRELPAEEFAKVELVELEFPKKAQIYPTIICSSCGEGAMESRVRMVNGQIVCLACAGVAYSKACGC